MTRPTPAAMPMVSAAEWERRERAHKKAESERHSREHGITNSRAYAQARAKAGLK